ncbi:MAG TPA: phenylacetate--CoA ligase family protein [Candidatus Binatia bacterium]|nr:phenylacetate--CoA ligase family protein [Candidatus Binatia bacterium]
MEVSPGRKAVEAHQIEKLSRMLKAELPSNAFYRRKLFDQGFSNAASLSEFRKFPFTTKSELVEDQAAYPPFGSALTFPVERYMRIHQTSGTTGNPIYWLDTEESWQWWSGCWKTIFEAAGVRPDDRIFFAFSFGPFIGFWSGWEGARKLGALAIPGGGQSTAQRLKAIMDYGATVLVCTPTYALHMGDEARKIGLDLANKSQIRITIHAGEPGANIPSTRRRIEEIWGAKCYDHPGATEIGPYAFECEARPGGVHINEDEYIGEVIDPINGEPTQEGERGELIMTNLGRYGSPVIRYRTGDLVEPSFQPCACERSFMLLRGGVLGRADDMIIVRGVNVYPSAIENIMREFIEIEEFKIETFVREELRELKLIIEPRTDCASPVALKDMVARRFRERLGLRPEVEDVAPGTLPRFELKAKRFYKL